MAALAVGLVATEADRAAGAASADWTRQRRGWTLVSVVGSPFSSGPGPVAAGEVGDAVEAWPLECALGWQEPGGGRQGRG